MLKLLIILKEKKQLIRQLFSKRKVKSERIAIFGGKCPVVEKSGQ